ncbi:MAG: carbohydrate-binding domain-containing protein [Bacteroidaceae bacterium]|nr:carbohydrate-binding domain-containing protein [Bacteroidaceae bacterium]
MTKNLKRMAYALFTISLMNAFTACSTDDDVDDYVNPSNTGGNTSGQGSGSSGSTASTSASGSLKELLSLDIAFDTSELSETETIPDQTDELYENYIENDFEQVYTVSITYDGTNATASGDTEAVNITRGENPSDIVVTSEVKGVRYILKGATSDGSFKIYSEKKFALELSGVSITNPTGAAINNQGKRAFVVLTDGTTNSLCDGAVNSSGDYPDQSGSDEDMKATFFSEGKLTFSGSGTLNITSKGKNGLVSDDFVLFRPGCHVTVSSTSGHCIKTNDGIFVRGGVINCQTSATAAKALKTDSIFRMQGGRVTAITTGGGAYDSDENDVSAAAGVRADQDILISGGELLCKSTGAGGKGISTDKALTVSGGTVKVYTTGRTYTYTSNLDSKAKGIKADGNILVSGGTVWARAMGDSGSAGIETKGTYTQEGGTVAVYSVDDAVNSKSHMVINDGFLYGYATGNDGIDSNGNLTVNGGVLIGCGAGAPEEGVDAAEGYQFIVNGGTVIGIGGGGESVSGSQQKAAVSGVSVSGGSYIAVSGGSTALFALQLPCQYNNATVQLSSPKFSSNTTYSFLTASDVSGDEVFGFIAAPTISSSSSLTSFTTSSSISGGMGGGMGGGNQGGGPGGGFPH